ncbi:MAG TPA: phosphatidylglycerophosphatase A [Pyrinomonadaceae bacterium]|nr:phosphatidylglycerophosphatase A [Pyrinomonadaceae bacterium]
MNPVPSQSNRRSASDYIALAIATCGVGYIPIAPGTWGSLVAVGLYLVLRSSALALQHRLARTNSLALFDPGVLFVAIELLVITLVTLIGFWAASRAERIFQKKDPGKVVIDEVAGQLIALLPVPLWVIGPWRVWIVVAFLLFRAFDIIKPYPIRRLEALESGLGIVVDDLAAGAYAAVMVSAMMAVFAILS